MKKVGVVGIKQSFEDEGVLDKDLVTISQLCKLTELEFMKGQAELLGLEIPDEYFKISDTVMNRIDPKFRRYLGLGSMGVATALNYSGLSSPNTTPKQTGNTMFPNSTSIFREDSNLSSDVFELVGGM